MILEWTAKVTLILAVTALASLLLRRSSAASRHLVQVLGLAATLVLPVASLALPSWEMAVLAPQVAPSADASAAGAPPAPVDSPRPLGIAPTDLALAPQPGLATPRERPAAPAPESPGAAPRPSECECDCDGEEARSGAAARGTDDRTLLALATHGGGSADSGVSAARTESTAATAGGVRRLLAIVWVLGCALVLARLVLGWLRMTRIAIEATPLAHGPCGELLESCSRRLGLASAPRVLVSDAVRVPVLWGFLRPTLLLPPGATDWPAPRLRVTLLHELAHLRRLDGLALLLGRLAAALWWFNPLVWLVERGARRDCETACDDAVLACGERPSTYAVQLLRIAGELPAPAGAPAGALAVVGRGGLAGRVRSILRPGVRRGLGRRAAVALLAVTCVGLVTVSSARLVARPAHAEPSPALEPAVSPALAVEPEIRVAVNAIQENRFKVRPRVRVRAADRKVQDGVMLVHDSRDDRRRESGRLEFERAYEHHRAEEFEQASRAFIEAAELGFRPATSYYNAACGEARLGHAATAVELLEQALGEGFDSWQLLQQDSDLDPIRRDAAFRAVIDELRDEGRMGRYRGDRYDAALDRYEDLRDSDSDEGEAWHQVGTTLLSLRDFERSVDALDRAARLLGDRGWNALYNTACAYSLQGDTARALDYLERAVLAGFESDERFTNDSDLDAIRGERRFDEIERLHDELSLDRYRSKSWFGDGSEYSRRRWEPAVEDFTAFTREHPEIGRGWHNLGWSLHFSRRHAEARDAFSKQLELGYMPRNATYNIACTYAMEGDADAALEWLGRAVDEHDMSVHQLLGDRDLESLHDDPRFEELLERAAENGDLRQRWNWRHAIHWREPAESDDPGADAVLY